MTHLKSFMLSWVVSCCCCLECWPVFLEVDWCSPLVLALFYRLLQHRCASRKTTNKLQRGSSTGAPLEKNDAHANCQQKQFRKYVQLKAERGGHSHYREQSSAVQAVLFHCCTWEGETIWSRVGQGFFVLLHNCFAGSSFSTSVSSKSPATA